MDPEQTHKTLEHLVEINKRLAIQNEKWFVYLN